jgi:hypothetical protein
MSILNLNTPQGRGPRNRKSTKIWMGVGLLAAVLGFGSTFAANITLNNSNTTEFAQGIQTTVYCGSSSPTLTIIPQSTYTGSAFKLTGFKVQGIPKKCSDRDFVFTFLDSSSAPLKISNNTVDNLTVYWQDDSTPKYPIAVGGSSSGCDLKKSVSPSAWTNVAWSGNTTLFGALLSTSRNDYSSACTFASVSKVNADTSSNTSAGNGSFVITFLGGTYALSSDLSKIAVETQEDVFGLVSCTVQSDSSKVSCPSTYGLFNSSS